MMPPFTMHSMDISSYVWVENPNKTALENACMHPEFTTLLDTPLLQHAFLEAAQNNRDFTKSCFAAIEDSQSLHQHLQTSTIFQHSLLTHFENDIVEQKKDSQYPLFWEKVQLYPTMTQTPRPPDEKIRYVILGHYADLSPEAPFKSMPVDMVNPKSVHYMVDRKGHLTCALPDQYQGRYCRVSYWEKNHNMDACSIVVLLANDIPEAFPKVQIDTLIELLQDLKTRHHIPVENFIADTDVAPARSATLNTLFPWPTLAAKGYGLFLSPAEQPTQLPENFNPVLALQQLGYDVSQQESAIRMFNQHHRQTYNQFKFDPNSLGILHGLVLKKEALRTTQLSDAHHKYGYLFNF
jgi:N-acetylmuramoyl-L-alanine amidase